MAFTFTKFTRIFSFQLLTAIICFCRESKAKNLRFASTLVTKIKRMWKLQYETICSKTLADEATSLYSSGKAFAYDYVLREEVVTFAKKTDSTLNIRVDSQRRSLNRILLLFTEPYAAGARYSEKYVNLDIKVSVTMKSSPNNVYNNGFEGHDMWKEISRFFPLEKQHGPHKVLHR